jgi:hypothetical protein
MSAHKHTLAGIVSALTNKRMEPCPHCNGTGLYVSKAYPDFGPEGCAECDATGLVEECFDEDEPSPAHSAKIARGENIYRMKKEAF